MGCFPGLHSVAVVPVGLTRFREDLPDIPPVNSEKALEVLAQIDSWQERCLKEIGTRFVYAADEIYLQAGTPLPLQAEYEGFPQIENGVGLLSKLRQEFGDALKKQKKFDGTRTVTLATGTAAASAMKELCRMAEAKCPGLTVNVVAVPNDFFGNRITVAGLLTGQDLVKTLEIQPLGDEILITQSMLKSGETVFLDDYTVERVAQELNVSVRPVESEGTALLDALLGKGGTHHGKTHRRNRRPS